MAPAQDASLLAEIARLNAELAKAHAEMAALALQHVKDILWLRDELRRAEKGT